MKDELRSPLNELGRVSTLVNFSEASSAALVNVFMFGMSMDELAISD
jgi:hypothetical protein